MMKTMMRFYELSQGMMESGMTVAEIRQSPMITKISRMKDIENDVFEDKAKELWAEMESGMVAR